MNVKHTAVVVAALDLGLTAASTSAQQPQSQGAQTAAAHGGKKTVGLITFSGTDPSANIVISSAK